MVVSGARRLPSKLRIGTLGPGVERAAGDPALELVVERVGRQRCSIDFAETFAALEEIGYDGTITFESFSSAVVSPALTRALCIWRETWDDSMELATSARRFVLEQRAAATA